MRKTIAVVLILVLVTMLPACMTIKYSESGQAVTSQTRVMFVLGLIPIGNTNFKPGPHTETMDFLDVLITGITGGILYSRSVIPGGM